MSKKLPQSPLIFKSSPKAHKKPRQKTGRYVHDWPPSDIALLGTMTDLEASQIIGVSHKAAASKRLRMNILPYTPQVPEIEWTDEMLETLGKLSDKAIARRFGISYVTVSVKRQALKINTPFPSSAPTRWTPDMVELLGTMSDVDFAQQFHIANSTFVTKKRMRMGIAAYKPPELPEHVRVLLGTQSDPVIAQQVGMTADKIAYWRRKLSIPAWHAQFTEPKPKVKGPDAPRQPSRPKVQWSDAMIALLGTHTDVEISKRLGLSRELVRNERRKHGIASWYSPQIKLPNR
jgi:hypothetical protein